MRHIECLCGIQVVSESSSEVGNVEPTHLFARGFARVLMRGCAWKGPSSSQGFRRYRRIVAADLRPMSELDPLNVAPPLDQELVVLEFSPEAGTGGDVSAVVPHHGDMDTRGPKRRRVVKHSLTDEEHMERVLRSRMHPVGSADWLTEREFLSEGPSTVGELFDWPASLYKRVVELDAHAVSRLNTQAVLVELSSCACECVICWELWVTNVVFLGAEHFCETSKSGDEYCINIKHTAEQRCDEMYHWRWSQLAHKSCSV